MFRDRLGFGSGMVLLETVIIASILQITGIYYAYKKLGARIDEFIEKVEAIDM